jgi:hypothetical protein
MSVFSRSVARVTALACFLISWNALAVPVVPGGFATTEGESNNVIPFTNAFGTGYQQVYDAAGFGGVNGAITSIAFRLDADQPLGYTNTGQVNLSVKLGAAGRSSQNVSTSFAENRGSEPLEVFNGMLSFALTDVPGLGPNPFDLLIAFERPFFFDGMQNLLLELTLLEPLLSTDPLGIPLDAASGPFGRAFSTSVGNLANLTFGLITQFDITPAAVPEPPLVMLFLLGLAMLFPLRQRQVRSGTATCRRVQ